MKDLAAEVEVESTPQAAQKPRTAGRPARAEKLKGPCPSFFKAACYTARQDGYGYKGAAKTLLPHISGSNLMPDEIESDAEWDSRLKAFAAAIDSRDDDAVLGWLDTNLPRCMALVPRPRRGAFLEGIYEAVEEDGVVIDGILG